MRVRLPDHQIFIGETIPRHPGYVIQEYISQGANGLVFRAFSEATQANVAFKIVPQENLRRGSGDQYLDEARKANLLENACVVKYHDVVQWRIRNRRYFVFVCDYVKGTSLREFIRSQPGDIDIVFVMALLETLFGLLHELQLRQMQHGDLHSGNIIVARSEFDIDSRTVFRVTDFGVAMLSARSAHANDYLYVADILRSLLECVEYRDCDPQSRYAFDVLRQEFLARHLIETDVVADPLACNPRALVDKLRGIGGQYRERTRGAGTARLITPFDYPNCEQIGNSHLLLQTLYSDRLLGLADIEGRSNLVLTGPRGCGKTTVFRALCLEYLMSTRNDHPRDLRYIGIYYRCDDLYFAFPRYRRRSIGGALDIPMHFLVCTILAGVLEQLTEWARKYFGEEFESEERRLVLELWKLLEWETPGHPSGDRMETLITRLKEKERQRAVRRHRVARQSPQSWLGPEMMVRVLERLRRRLSFLATRPFYVFVDDYSLPKITKDLQVNLNRILMHRSPDVFFKLSTESPVSFVREDIDGKQFVESREYDLLNLGLRHIKVSADSALEFLEDLFGRRFKQVTDYPVSTLKELLGSRKRNENQIARDFRSNSNTRGRETTYAGCETIAAMSSGDVHYMIRLVARMVEDYGGREALARSQRVPRIPWINQSDAIRSAAGSFMESIRTLPGNGPRLAAVVTAFGNVARSYLLYEVSRNEGGKPPHQATRIEPYEPLSLSDDARNTLDDLLRYSVFIEDPRGKSRRGKVVPRLYLRRYLIPHFRLTFSRRDSIELESSEIEKLLCDPDEFEKSYRLRSEEGARARRNIDRTQGDLFSEE